MFESCFQNRGTAFVIYCAFLLCRPCSFLLSGHFDWDWFTRHDVYVSPHLCEYSDGFSVSVSYGPLLIVPMEYLRNYLRVRYYRYNFKESSAMYLNNFVTRHVTLTVLSSCSLSTLVYDLAYSRRQFWMAPLPYLTVA